MLHTAAPHLAQRLRERASGLPMHGRHDEGGSSAHGFHCVCERLHIWLVVCDVTRDQDLVPACNSSGHICERRDTNVRPVRQGAWDAVAKGRGLKRDSQGLRDVDLVASLTRCVIPIEAHHLNVGCCTRLSERLSERLSARLYARPYGWFQ